MYQLPKVKALGTDRDHQLLPVANYWRVDEKIDGSQFSFGIADGVLWCRSKSAPLDLVAPNKMFAAGVAEVVRRQFDLLDGHTYVGEYLQRPKHNVLCYNRVPANHVCVFDVVDPDGHFLRHGDMVEEAARIGFEGVESTIANTWEEVEAITTMVNGLNSQLGGVAEGVVIKTGLHVSDRVIAKVVADRFHEVKQDRTERSIKNPEGDITITLANKYCPPARYMKALQRLREAGEADGSLKDIQQLRRLVVADLEGECGDMMREELYQKFRKDIMKNSLKGILAWYEQLLYNDNVYWSEQREALGTTTP